MLTKITTLSLLYDNLFKIKLLKNRTNNRLYDQRLLQITYNIVAGSDRVYQDNHDIDFLIIENCQQKFQSLLHTNLKYLKFAYCHQSPVFNY